MLKYLANANDFILHEIKTRVLRFKTKICFVLFYFYMHVFSSSRTTVNSEKPEFLLLLLCLKADKLFYLEESIYLKNHLLNVIFFEKAYFHLEVQHKCGRRDIEIKQLLKYKKKVCFIFGIRLR